MPYHAEMRWLRRGKVRGRSFEIREEVSQFTERRGKDTAEMRDKKFLSELALLSDIVSHLDVCNCKDLQN